MALETTNYQCPSCNGTLRYVGKTGMLTCDYCGSTFTAKQIEDYYAKKQAVSDAKAGKGAQQPSAQPEGAQADAASPKQAKAAGAGAAAAKQDPIQEYLKRSRWESDEKENLRVYTCSSCGAELVTDKSTAVTSCPYCGNTTVIPGQLADALKPNYVIPFKLDKQAAIEKLKQHYKNKWLLPDDFSEKNHLEEIQGVYVPFWLFTADAQGQGDYQATQVFTWADSKNTYVKTDFYNVKRMGKMHFEKVPVDGSTKMPDAHMDAIEPFDYSELQPFSIGYLPGYLTDRYDEEASDCRERAERRIRKSTSKHLEASVTGYASVSENFCNVKERWDNVAYTLLPVWMLHTRWNGQDFLFAMNDQTGKLVGDLPIDKRKRILWDLLAFVPLFAFNLFVFFMIGN